MYIKDLFLRLVEKRNIPVVIYLILNVIIIGAIITGVFSLPVWAGFLIGIAIYALSLVIALSPVGEWIVRMQNGCRKIKRQDQLDYIMPIFSEVYAQARQNDPSIPTDVKLYVNSDECPNAFATGRKTVCVTEGMLNMPQVQVKAALGHEFGHLAHKDTDLLMLVAVGNLIISAIIIVIRICITLFHFVLTLVSIIAGGPEGVVGVLFSAFTNLLMTIFVAGLTWIWTKIGVLLVMKSSRAGEYEADAFSYRLGYGEALCALLDTCDGTKTKGLFAVLSSSHPDKDDRIARLQALGCTYRNYYGEQQASQNAD